jgi:hypothetical protein
MDFLTPKTIPFIFLGVGLVYLVMFLRGRSRPDPAGQIAQRSRLRLAIIFGVVGVGQLLWRVFGR